MGRETLELRFFRSPISLLFQSTQTRKLTDEQLSVSSSSCRTLVSCSPNGTFACNRDCSVRMALNYSFLVFFRSCSVPVSIHFKMSGRIFPGRYFHYSFLLERDRGKFRLLENTQASDAKRGRTHQSIIGKGEFVEQQITTRFTWRNNNGRKRTTP